MHIKSGWIARFPPLGGRREGLDASLNPSPPHHKPAAPLPREGAFKFMTNDQ